MTLRERVEGLEAKLREREIGLPEAVGLTPAALLNEIADELAAALAAEGQGEKCVRCGDSAEASIDKADVLSEEWLCSECISKELNELRRAAAPSLHKEGHAERFRRLFGSDLTGSPQDAAFIEDAGQIYNDGFEAAHALRHCGHSVGDYRDAGYTPGQPETYTASESCIGCEREAELHGVISGLEDVIAGRTKPLEQIRAELAALHRALELAASPAGRAAEKEPQ